MSAGRTDSSCGELYAALMQQTSACAPLRCAGNFSAIHHYICRHGISETYIGRDSALRCPRTPQRGVPTHRCQFHASAIRSQSIAQSAVNFFVDRLRRFAEGRFSCRNNNRISEIFTVKNDSAARPSPDQIALRDIINDICEFSKISKRESRGVPSIKTNRGNFGSF
jgi:hypothetical protein